MKGEMSVVVCTDSVHFKVNHQWGSDSYNNKPKMTGSVTDGSVSKKRRSKSKR